MIDLELRVCFKREEPALKSRLFLFGTTPGDPVFCRNDSKLKDIFSGAASRQITPSSQVHRLLQTRNDGVAAGRQFHPYRPAAQCFVA